MNKRKMLTMICTALIFIAITSIPALASSGGIFENGITWTLEDSGTLKIEGDGSIPASMSSSDIPWYQSRTKIRLIIILM